MDSDDKSMLARIDERTKNMDYKLDHVDQRLDSQSKRLGSVERDRNILYGAWLALAAIFGIHVKGH